MNSQKNSQQSPSITNPKLYTLLALAIAYLVIRFGFTPQLDALGEYASYIFEVVLVAITFAALGKSSLQSLRLVKPAFIGAAISLVAGFGIFKLAGGLGLQIPFDLKGAETIFLLLIVAPILEEAIFRFFLWQPLQLITRRPAIALILTSLLFSYSHLHAIWFVPAEFHAFIIYQASYTLLLAFACGSYVYRFNSVTAAILIHFGFNLGFYIGAQLS